MSSTPVEFNTLSELITRLKELKLQPDAVYSSLMNMIGSMIDFRCEKVAKVSTPEDEDCETEPVLPTFRVLLNAKRQGADYSKQLSNQCNGVILSYPTWDILAMPPKKFNPRFRLKDVNLEDYKVFEIKDGTCCTLYYSSGWTMGSANGFDVSDYRWMGETTYLDALSEVLNSYPEFSFDKLDKTKSYTIGFRHHSFHPLIADPQSAWFVQSYDQVTGTISTDTDIGIPIQSPVVITMEVLTEKNTTAMANYLTTERTGVPVIHYGYFLRTSGTTSDLMVESELLKQVRCMIYNLPKGKYGTVLTHQNRLEYTVLRAYLSLGTKFTFINLFPQFKTQYCVYDEFFKKLVAQVITIMRTRKSVVKTLQTSQGQTAAELKIAKLANCLVSHIETYEYINAMDSQGINIITDFITDKHYLDLYHACLLA